MQNKEVEMDPSGYLFSQVFYFALVFKKLSLNSDKESQISIQPNKWAVNPSQNRLYSNTNNLFPHLRICSFSWTS